MFIAIFQTFFDVMLCVAFIVVTLAITLCLLDLLVYLQKRLLKKKRHLFIYQGRSYGTAGPHDQANDLEIEKGIDVLQTL